jgi:hypothetical protein
MHVLCQRVRNGLVVRLRLAALVSASNTETSRPRASKEIPSGWKEGITPTVGTIIRLGRVESILGIERQMFLDRLHERQHGALIETEAASRFNESKRLVIVKVVNSVDVTIVNHGELVIGSAMTKGLRQIQALPQNGIVNAREATIRTDEVEKLTSRPHVSTLLRPFLLARPIRGHDRK